LSFLQRWPEAHHCWLWPKNSVDKSEINGWLALMLSCHCTNLKTWNIPCKNLLSTAIMWPMFFMKTLNLPFQKSVIVHSYELMIMHLVHCLAGCQ
jgi:hypothetical protein